MAKNIIITILVVLLLITGMALVWALTDRQNLISSIEEDKTGIENKQKPNINVSSNAPHYILSQKTLLPELCNNENNFKGSLGIIQIGSGEYELSVDLNNINSFKTTGTITLWSNTINVSALGLGYQDYKIEGFEVYNNYFIVHFRTADTAGNLGTNLYHEYGMQIYDTSLNKIADLRVNTVGTFEDFNISNGILTYDSFLNITSPKIKNIYDASRNVHKFDLISTTAQITMSDLISGNFDNQTIIEIDYSHGEQQRQ